MELRRLTVYVEAQGQRAWSVGLGRYVYLDAAACHSPSPPTTHDPVAFRISPGAWYRWTLNT
jgi:hypothetical protein